MTVCLFLGFSFGGGLTANEHSDLNRLLRAAPRLAKALIHTPSAARHPYVEEGPLPGLVLQLYFPHLLDLETSLSCTGSLRALTSRAEFPILGSAEITEQAMLVRSFDVSEPAPQRTPDAYCTYLVSYEGRADDLCAWHAHYLESHTRCVAMLPRVRELEVYTRLDWASASPWVKHNHMQRNKVVFEGVDDLEAALASPVRQTIRADFQAFPPFTGPSRHVAMATHVVKP